MTSCCTKFGSSASNEVSVHTAELSIPIENARNQEDGARLRGPVYISVPFARVPGRYSRLRRQQQQQQQSLDGRRAPRRPMHTRGGVACGGGQYKPVGHPRRRPSRGHPCSWRRRLLVARPDHNHSNLSHPQFAGVRSCCVDDERRSCRGIRGGTTPTPISLNNPYCHLPSSCSVSYSVVTLRAS